MKKFTLIILIGIFLMIGVTSIEMISAAAAGDLSWANQQLVIYESNLLTSGAGTEVCSLSLTDTDNQIISCTNGAIKDSTDYCLETNITCVGGADVECKWKWADEEDSTQGYFNIIGVMGAGNIFGNSATVNDCAFIYIDGEHKNAPDCNPFIHSTQTDTIQFHVNGSNNKAEVKIKTTDGGTKEGLRVCVTSGTGTTDDNSTYLYALENKGGVIEQSNNLSIESNVKPLLDNLTASASTIKGGEPFTIYANTSTHGVNDSDADTLYLYCSSTDTPTSANTDCIGGSLTFDTTYPYTFNCIIPSLSDDLNHTEYCRTYDGFVYSNVSNITYVSDSSPPSISVTSVAGDTVASYFDTINNGRTDILVEGEENMICRYYSTDTAYTSGSGTTCSVSGTQANCSISDIFFQEYTTRYVACQDQYGNSQNTSQNLDVSFYLDYTMPTTSDNSVISYQAPPYSVTLTEGDNVDSDPDTIYCTDTTNTCSPSLSIDNGGTVTFTTSNRGINYLRYNSTDDAGNIQDASSTININQLPIFTSATDDATTIAGGTTVNISTVSLDSDSHDIILWVCNTTSISASGCGDGNYCNATETTNLSCTFTAELDSTTHTWYAYLYDALDETAVASKSGSYTTDTTAPIISIVAPTNYANITQNSTTFTINVNEALTNAWYTLNNGKDNITMSNTSLLQYTNQNTSIADANYSIIFWANDTYGNIGPSETYTFTINTIPPDTAPPAITLISPSNGSYSNPTNTLINVSGSENLSWAGYQLNGGTINNLDNYSLTNWNITLTTLSQETVYNLTIWANDTANNPNNKTFVFYSDSSAPRHSNAKAVPSPANVSQAVNCSITWTDTFNITSVKISENSSGTFENHTITFSGTSGTVSYNIIGAKLANPGTYTCRFHATDTAGNFNTTSVNFNVNDVTSPIITTLSPNNVTYNQANISISIITNENITWAGYSLNGSSNVTLGNTSSINWNSTLFNLDNGGYTIQFFANDSSGNMANSSIIHFSVDVAAADTVSPIITINTISNGTYYTSTSLDLNITSNENATWASYKLNSGSLVDMTNLTNHINWNSTLTSLGTESTNTIEVYANDSATPANKGNTNITFYVDTLNPRITSITATPNPANETQNVICNSYINDTFSLTNVKIEENSTGIFINHTISLSSAGWANYTILNVEKGKYTCRFHATDTAGNINSSESTTFSVNDVVAPIITINSPLNQSYSTDSILLSITLNENASAAVNYTLDGGITNISLDGSESTWSKTVTLSNGGKNVTFYAYDDSNNLGINSISFAVDTTSLDSTPPVITLLSPTNNTYYTSGSLIINITSDEALNWSGYTNNSGELVDLGITTPTNWNSTITLSEGQHNFTIYANDSSTNQNQNNKTISIWVDLTNPSVDSFTCADVNDSQNLTCTANVSDTIGLSYAIISYNATGSWQNSSNITISGTSDTLSYEIHSANTTPHGFQAKIYLYDSSKRNNLTESDTITISDDTIPTIWNITYQPNSTDDLDPETLVNINATIIEDHLIGDVYFMYRNLSDTTWTLINMTNLTKIAANTSIIYNASFTPQNETWYFKINATDTAGNQNISSNYTLVITNDTTQNITTTIPAIKSIDYSQRSSNNSLGTITMNNTGDGSIGFNVTLTSTSLGTRLSINYSGNQSYNYSGISSGEQVNITLDLNTTSLTAGLYNYTITIISEVGTRTFEKQLNIQTAANAYLTTTISTYSLAVTKGQTGVVLIAEVENSGTLDATNVYLNWTLPEAFTITSGTQNRSLGNLPIGSTSTNSITVSVASEIVDQMINITANATADSVDSSSDTKSMTIGSPVTVTQTETVSGSGGGGGGSSSSGTSLSEGIIYDKEIEIVRGDRIEFGIEVYNNNNTNQNLKDLVLEEIRGFLSQYITIKSNKINIIGPDQTKSFKIVLEAPIYNNYEEHDLTAIIKGKKGSNNLTRSYSETQNILLRIQKISRENATVSLSQAKQEINLMQEKEFNTRKIERLYNQSYNKLHRDKRNWQSYELSQEVIKIKTIAFKADNLIERIKEALFNPKQTFGLLGHVTKEFTDEQGNTVNLKQVLTGKAVFSSEPLEDVLNMAIAAFERGDYETALERAEKSQVLVLLERKGNFIFFIYLYWPIILFSIILLSVSGVVSYRKYKKTSLTKQIQDLNKEEENINRLSKENQQKYFLKKTSVGDYQSTKDQLTKRLANLRKSRIRFRNMRLKILKPRQILQELDNEKTQTEEEIKKIQKEYYVDKKISENEYKTQFNVLNERIAEIEGERITLQVLRGERELRKQKPIQKKETLNLPKTSESNSGIDSGINELSKANSLEKNINKEKFKELRKKEFAKVQRTERRRKTWNHFKYKTSEFIEDTKIRFGKIKDSIKTSINKLKLKRIYKKNSNDKKGVILIDSQIIEKLKKLSENKDYKGRYINLNLKEDVKNEK
jgi:hypothetical protein